MESTDGKALPSYQHEDIPTYEDVPAYESSARAGQHPPALSTGTNLTLDPTGMFIKTVPSSDAPPVYSLNKSILHTSSTMSIHVIRPETRGGETSSLAVYAIGEHFISPLHSRKRILQHVTAARSHGLLVFAGVREIVWDFSTRVPLKKGEGPETKGVYAYPTDPVYMIGTSGSGQGTVQKHLLQLSRGEWVDDDDQVLALEREGGAECEGMPMLSIMKDLDQEMADFLVSAWCVTMWDDAGKRAHKNSSSGHKLNIGKFNLG